MKLLPLIPFALVALSSSAFAESGMGSQNPEQNSSQEFFVVDTGLRCKAAPCPSFSAVNSKGVAFEVAEVEFLGDIPEGAPRDLAKGVSIQGEIVLGDWNLGSSGNVLLVDEVVAEASSFTAEQTNIVCFRAPCPNIEVTDAKGNTLMVGKINLESLQIDQLSKAALHGNIVRGQKVVFGFVNKDAGGYSSDVELLVTSVSLHDINHAVSF